MCGGSFLSTALFITKFTDLDRCFLISRLGLDNGKELVLINVHLSAYDQGGTIRRAAAGLAQPGADSGANREIM